MHGGDAHLMDDRRAEVDDGVDAGGLDQSVLVRIQIRQLSEGLARRGG